RRAPRSTLFPYTTLFRSADRAGPGIPLRALRARRAAHPGSRGPAAERHRVRRLLNERLELRTLDLDRVRLVVEEGRVALVRAHRSEEHTSELLSRFDLVC